MFGMYEDCLLFDYCLSKFRAGTSESIQALYKYLLLLLVNYLGLNILIYVTAVISACVPNFAITIRLHQPNII